MADQRITSNGHVDVWLVPVASIADASAPTATEINTYGLRITPAVAWDGTTFPAATESDDVDDRSLEDVGNATTRGAQSFEAVLNFYYPKSYDSGDEYAEAYDFVKTPGLNVYVITRVLQRDVAPATTDATAGDWISVYKGVTDGWQDDLADDDSYKYAVTILPQGEMYVYTQVKTAGPVVLRNISAVTAPGVGDVVLLGATLGGHEATQSVSWSSSDETVATVSQNGVVTVLTTDEVDITATHPAATGATVAITLNAEA